MADTNKRPYVNPVKCLNNEWGHNYQHELSLSIDVPKLDPVTGKIEGNLQKKYKLEMVCQEHNCGSRLFLYEKIVDMSVDVSLAEMLVEYRA